MGQNRTGHRGGGDAPRGAGISRRWFIGAALGASALVLQIPLLRRLLRREVLLETSVAVDGPVEKRKFLMLSDVTSEAIDARSIRLMRRKRFDTVEVEYAFKSGAGAPKAANLEVDLLDASGRAVQSVKFRCQPPADMPKEVSVKPLSVVDATGPRFNTESRNLPAGTLDKVKSVRVRFEAT